MPVAGTPVTLRAFWEESLNSPFGHFALESVEVTFTPAVPSAAYVVERLDAGTFEITIDTANLNPGTYTAALVGTSVVAEDAPFTDTQSFSVTAPVIIPPTGAGLIPIYTTAKPLQWINGVGAPTNIKNIALTLLKDGEPVTNPSAHVRVDTATFTLTVNAVNLGPGDYVARSTGTTYDDRTVVDEVEFRVGGGGPGPGEQWVYPPEAPLVWQNVFGIATEILSIGGQVSQEGLMFPNTVTYTRVPDAGGVNGFSESTFVVSVNIAGMPPGVYSLGTTAESDDHRTLHDVATFVVSGGAVPVAPPDGSYPKFTISDLSTFSGRPKLSYSSFALEAIDQATELMKLATCRKTWPTDEDETKLMRRAILSVADGLVLSQPHQEVMANPFQSESLASYSYSKLQKQIHAGLPTGNTWFDLAVENLSICELSYVTSDSIDVFDTRPPAFGRSAIRIQV